MEGHHQHQLQHQYGGVHNINIQGGADSSTTVGGGAADRFPQWSMGETRDFLMIRAELDQTFMETKRNKLLWEVISTKMREKGHNRSAEQCKCKWKNLVTRYKGCETMEPEGTRQQFPFYNELQGIFAARMQRMLWMEAEAGAGAGGSGSKKAAATALSSEEEDDPNEDSEGDQRIMSMNNIINNPSPAGNRKKKRKIKGGGGSSSTSNPGGGATHAVVNSLKEVMEEFTKQQLQMEMEWLKAYEAREEERKKREIEWRQTMEALEKERLMMDKRWREREEQRRIREEARAERRDALVTALLNKLRDAD